MFCSKGRGYVLSQSGSHRLGAAIVGVGRRPAGQEQARETFSKENFPLKTEGEWGVMAGAATWTPHYRSSTQPSDVHIQRGEGGGYDPLAPPL